MKVRQRNEVDFQIIRSRFFHLRNACTSVFFCLHVVRMNFRLLTEFRPVSVMREPHICVHQSMHVAQLLWYFSCRSKRNPFSRIMYVKKLFEGNSEAAYGKHKIFLDGMLHFSFQFRTISREKKSRSTILKRVKHLSDGRNESLRIKVYEAKMCTQVSRHWMWLRMAVTDGFHYDTSRIGKSREK